MPIDTGTQKENLAAEYGTRAAFVSLHAGDPGATGANEITGGTPAYARVPAAWTGGAVDGVVTVTLTFDVPGGVTVDHVGLWATDGTTFLDGTSITPQPFASQGTYQVTLTYTQS